MPSCSLLRVVTTAALTAVVLGCASNQSAALPNEVPGAFEPLGLTQLAVAPAVRRVWTGPEVQAGTRPSPDGRFLTMTDWNSGGLILRDLIKGSIRTIPVTTQHPWEYALSSAISPEGLRVAYTWVMEDRARAELRLATLSETGEGGSETILSAPEIREISVHSWTPDGREIMVVVTGQTGVHEIVAVGAVGGGRRLLRRLGLDAPGNLSVSPDGRWIAYDLPEGRADRDIHVLGIDGARDHVVAGDPGEEVVLGWTGHPARLLFASERGGTPAAWALTMEGGRAVGEPVLVRSDLWRATPAGMTADGRAFYFVESGEQGVHTVPVDPATGMVDNAASRPVDGTQFRNLWSLGWNAQGDQVAYTVRRGGGLQGPHAPDDVVIRSVKGDHVQVRSPALTRIYELHWFPDGRSLLLGATDTAKILGLYRMNIEDGALTLLHRLVDAYALAVSPDGGSVYFVGIDGPGIGDSLRAVTPSAVLVRALDLVRGTVALIRRIEDTGHPWGLAINPDGQSLAIGVTRYGPSERGRLYFLPLTDEDERIVHQVGPLEYLARAGLAWTPDGGNLLFGVTERGRGHEGTELLRFSLSDGRVTPTGLRMKGLGRFKLSPDGRTLGFGGGVVSLELWTMDPPDFGPSPGGHP